MSNAAVNALALNTLQRTFVPRSTRPILKVSSTQDSKKKVLFVTPEFADLIKTGGLGDVSAALPRALGKRHDVRLLIPGYAQVMNSGHPIRMVGRVEADAGMPACRIGRMDMPDGLIVYVLVCPELYERDGGPYGDPHGRDWPDNPVRFARLSLAAADIAAGHAAISWIPELLHAHDWPAGLVPAYARWRGLSTPSVFTIHNLGYQGLIDMSLRHTLAIPDSACHMEEMEFYGQLSLLKAGIAYADHVTTVSANYAHEITTPEFGYGLDGFLRVKARKGLLSGIVNGIDDSWVPRSDPHLIAGFDRNDLSGKAVNAAYVRDLFGLEPSSGPLFAVVSRLVHQKGIDLTLGVAETIVEHGGQIAIIGCGEEHIEQAVHDLAARFPGQVGAHVGFCENEARRMYAGSDFLLMPSRYEPCGLSQMYALRYGSLPVARRTGGLADTVEDGLTGFLFDEPSVASYRKAVLRAINVYRYPDLLNAMRTRAMATEFFWAQSIEPYDQLYHSLLLQRQVIAHIV
ncbi:glycogen synthase GlgA [Stutzerimonas tarimensis]|uniref:Glycogen synthase n=1 Tax=Stutzerimonas tarimensis TaxID=1507735 RepID=A0ABV7T268_9GAMM